MTLLALHNLSKSFGAVTVADGISFDVPQGQALGIIGPNGAGKSSLFNLITGNLRPDSGTVHLDGLDITHAPLMKRCQLGIGRSFQIPQPFGKLTVFENLLVAGAFGQNKSEADVAGECASVLDRTGLLSKANIPAGGLSLLDRKRLELARAMATNPRLLLLDEIAGGLTDGECAALVQTIRDLHSAGTTIIWIEHVLHALTAVVEKVLVLHFGRVLGIGAPAEIMARREVQEIYLGVEA